MSHKATDIRILDIVTVISNPIGWGSRLSTARSAINDWLSEPNVRITIVECVYGGRPHDLVDLANDQRVTHIPVRANTLAWNKECLLNIGVSRLAQDADNIAFLDADILFRRNGWALSVIHALDLYPVIQPWDSCYDLGPHDEHIQLHRSFASVYHAGGPVVPNGPKWWQSDKGPYIYPHTGFAWAWKRDVLDRVGGLFEVGGMGSGDHHMAMGIVGAIQCSVPGEAHPNYLDALNRWQARALIHINGKIGFVHGTIEHLFHGAKPNRQYNGRWQMFIDHAFDPVADLKRNTYGVLEFAGNKTNLELKFDNYMRSRMEDANVL